MSDDKAILFVKNYDDLSSANGYQFKFHCDLCGNGYMSSYKTSKLAIGSQLLRLASHFLGGGALSRVAGSSHEVERMVAGKAHDDALKEAVEEIKPRFKQCPRCGRWVCPDVCWNETKGLCKDCAPDLRNEVAAAQAQAATEQIRDRARNANLVKGIDVQEAAVACCPACGARVGATKFCPECGAPVAPKAKCPGCGAEVKAGAKFCPECGEKVTGNL